MDSAALRRVAEHLKSGGVAVFPTDTVYGIGTAAGSGAGMEKIYRLKRRVPDKPLPLLCAGLQQALPLAEFTPEAWLAASKFWPGALTLVLNTLPPGRSYCRGGATVGLRVPAHPKLRALIEALGEPLAATSANISGGPSAASASEAAATFGESADYVLAGATSSCGDSTVMAFTASRPQVLRAGALEPGIVLSYLKSISK